MEKPLHVRVAEALGWTAWLSKYGYWHITEPDGTRHEDGFDQPNPRFDSYSGERLPQRQWWDEYDPPRYDTDWSATGPLIEKYRIFLGPAYDDGDENDWHACLTSGESCLYGPDSHGPYAVAHTPLLAACNLILTLGEMGKLKEEI